MRMKFKVTDFITTNILSILGCITGIAELLWILCSTNVEKYQIIMSCLNFYFYNLFLTFILLITIVLTFLVPIEIYHSIKRNKKTINFNFKNAALKMIYNLIFYIGLIELYRMYWLLFTSIRSIEY